MLAMHHGKIGEAGRIISRLDLDGIRRALDLGGGSGTLSLALAEASPGLEVALFDRPEALEVARTIIPASLWGDRIKPLIVEKGDILVSALLELMI